eukprot:NODE_176_length_14102_cov_0.889595.p3 type:complete len:418 gc:universal NODE_176_length_14102_cov_0.889595:1985-3238(+)
MIKLIFQLIIGYLDRRSLKIIAPILLDLYPGEFEHYLFASLTICAELTDYGNENGDNSSRASTIYSNAELDFDEDKYVKSVDTVSEDEDTENEVNLPESRLIGEFSLRNRFSRNRDTTVSDMYTYIKLNGQYIRKLKLELNSYTEKFICLKLSQKIWKWVGQYCPNLTKIDLPIFGDESFKFLQNAKSVVLHVDPTETVLLPDMKAKQAKILNEVVGVMGLEVRLPNLLDKFKYVQDLDINSKESLYYENLADYHQLHSCLENLKLKELKIDIDIASITSSFKLNSIKIDSLFINLKSNGNVHFSPLLFGFEVSKLDIFAPLPSILYYLNSTSFNQLNLRRTTRDDLSNLSSLTSKITHLKFGCNYEFKEILPPNCTYIHCSFLSIPSELQSSVYEIYKAKTNSNGYKYHLINSLKS